MNSRSSRLPPLGSIRVFECAARHLNLRRAAHELCVTPGAVSQQIRTLEAGLGVALFERFPKGLRLTPSGQQLYPVAAQAMRSIQDAMERLRSPRRIVHVTVAPTLCTRWVVPRLGRFYEHHPDIEVRIDASTAVADLPNEAFDVAIRYARRPIGNLHHERIFADDVVPVCAAAVAEALAPVPQNLRRAKLLCWSTHDHWPSWISARGFGAYNEFDRVYFSHLMLALDAALAGQGVALSSLRLVRHDLAQRRLVRIFGEPVPTGFSYFLAARPEAMALPHVRAFADWIVAEAVNEQAVEGAI
ncbi:MAG TPA: LysR substrate-binding domain-containing protein [Xanthobacteraceae bacterium]|nr:LysR substrate-binding domain-containing protein [Xanthobacteraceae bacterium]